MTPTDRLTRLANAADRRPLLEDRVWAVKRIRELEAALEPFARVVEWAERNGHDLLRDFDMHLRNHRSGKIVGYLQVQSPDFTRAYAALREKDQP